MKTGLRFFSIALSVLLLASVSRAQYNAVGNSPPDRFPINEGAALPERTPPAWPVDQPPGPPPGAPRVANPVPAEHLDRPDPRDRPWLIVAPYAWAPGVKGTVASGVRSADVDLSMRDAVNDVLPDLRGAAMLHVEGGYGDVGFITDLTYLNVRPLDGFLRVESKSTLLDLLGFYRVINTGPGAGGFFFDVLAGARYYRFKNEITLQPIDFAPSDKTNSWWDLVVGARMGLQLTDSFGLFARADYGGFDIGDSPHRSCNVLVGFDWQCTECLSISGGYRWLKIDRTSGAGLDYSKIDLTLSGPFIALGLHF